MIFIGLPPVLPVAETDVASSQQEQKEARGDLWKRPQYMKDYEDYGDMFHSMFKESCHKLGYDPDDPSWSTGSQ